jgi:hypothetical protein
VVSMALLVVASARWGWCRELSRWVSGIQDGTVRAVLAPAK